MDKGARYYKCDFQVHSPRDINWDGQKPTSIEGRRAYACAFIAACREKELDAVAITDHHDIAFFSYIREASENEVDTAGQPVPKHQQIVVFPGMELTLEIPCQAIIILDADFPLEHLGSLYTVLGVSANDAELASHAPTVRVANISKLDELCDQLNRIDHFRGRYILLPNVSESRGSSILRKGFAHHYRDMSCVGGYLALQRKGIIMLTDVHL